jgi:hypothetical protein
LPGEGEEVRDATSGSSQTQSERALEVQ